MKLKRLIAPLVNLSIFAVAGIILNELGNRGAWTTENMPQQTESVQTEVPVGVGAVVRATLHRSLTAYGYVEAAPASAEQPAGEVHVTAPSAALVSEVDCIEGQQVEKGQMLFKLDARAADAAVQRARDFLANSEAMWNAPHPKDMPSWMTLIGQLQLEWARLQLQRAVVDRSLLSVTSPIAGTVARLNVRAGEVVGPAAAAVDVVDLDRLVVDVSVPGFYASDVKIGQSVLVELSGTSEPVQTEVSFIDPTLDPATGMASVDVAVPPNSELRPGQFVRAQIVIEQHNDCLAVPAEAIVTDSLGRAQIAIVSEDQRQATLQFVEPGIREADLVEVRGEDLHAGDSIVTSGTYGLASRTGIRVVGQ
ncbi:MAG: efflux RND transporter periplasmic adaptor subunit [Tepidisphaeraceae bacterium]|jgi:multidrug efflux pump subunit AcrA (membrane-fusion protein)